MTAYYQTYTRRDDPSGTIYRAIQYDPEKREEILKLAKLSNILFSTVNYYLSLVAKVIIVEMPSLPMRYKVMPKEVFDIQFEPIHLTHSPLSGGMCN